MTRPLFNHGIAKLEELFAASKADPRTLKLLEQELQHRQTLRASSLLAKVKVALPGLTSASRPARPSTSETVYSSQPDGLQPNLCEGRPLAAVASKTPSTHRSVVCTVPVKQTSVAPVTTRSSGEPVSDTTSAKILNLDDACKVLMAAPGFSWEEVEQTRRRLVQRAHPECLADVSDERRAQLRTEAKWINTAYAMLWQQRLNVASV